MSPITGELVPIGEMAEHMRISLIDPKYREQKEAMMAKIRDTTKGAPLQWGLPVASCRAAVGPGGNRAGAVVVPAAVLGFASCSAELHMWHCVLCWCHT